MHSFNFWKAFGKGLIATRDESTVIGTFHVDRRHPQKEYIRGLVLRAEALESALARLVSAGSSSRPIAEHEARELLAELSALRVNQPTQERQ